MKVGIALAAAAAVCALVLMGCSNSGPAGNKGPAIPDEEIKITSFSFWSSGSSADSFRNYSLMRDGESARLIADFITRDPVDVIVEEEAIAQLEGIVIQYQLSAWNGFDEVDNRVSDGSNFTLSIELENGKSIYAHGSNAFPQGFGEAEDAISMFFESLILQYGEVPEMLESSDVE